MREIKFRAWIGAYNYMAYQGTPDLETLQSFMHHYSNQQHLMQFTGLKDKNGVEIYEGDILKVSTDRFQNFKNNFKVEYNQKEACFEILQYWKNQDKWHPLSNKVSNYQYEVIGNIHDNPELL